MRTLLNCFFWCGFSFFLCTSLPFTFVFFSVRLFLFLHFLPFPLLFFLQSESVAKNRVITQHMYIDVHVFTNLRKTTMWSSQNVFQACSAELISLDIFFFPTLHVDQSQSTKPIFYAPQNREGWTQTKPMNKI